ncbi:carbonic anhydrase 2 [Phlebotomus argentipes]|uniref:carbonic anhydrase 2 n=1 Tax=Phlebotomus argentipes TaxID=94469 RepID=UPI0028935526|nr:carbonic anhydrase 2 [Phlebotomus argentipes]
MSVSWGYTATNGPQKWPEWFPSASGHRQSPINITTAASKQDGDLKSTPLRWKYLPENTRSLVNPGYCWRVDVNGKGSELTGGPLGADKYLLEQFHCHWGCSDNKGSEHTVDGLSYSGELHLVHWNATKYSSFDEAARQPDGLAVLGVFLKRGKHHPNLDKIVQLMPFITHKGDRVTLPTPLDPGSLLPSCNSGYWTYLGSLTTPPCSESVIWIIFKEPIEVSEDQLNAFRKLRCHDVCEDTPRGDTESSFSDGLVRNNYRPPLPVGHRDVREVGGH